MTRPSTAKGSQSACVQNLIPLVHVADVEASLVTYALLGFVTGETMKDQCGRSHWGIAESGKAPYDVCGCYCD